MRHLSLIRAEGHWAVLEFCGSVLMSPAGWDIAWRTSVSWKSALVFDISFRARLSTGFGSAFLSLAWRVRKDVATDRWRYTTDSESGGGTRCIELQTKKVGYFWNGSSGRLEIAVVLGDVFGPRTS